MEPTSQGLGCRVGSSFSAVISLQCVFCLVLDELRLQDELRRDFILKTFFNLCRNAYIYNWFSIFW